MNRLIFLPLALLLAASCMKSREEYQEAITDVREEQEAEARNEIQREEEVPAEPVNPRRSRGSNDREGMGMDE